MSHTDTSSQTIGDKITWCWEDQQATAKLLNPHMPPTQQLELLYQMVVALLSIQQALNNIINSTKLKRLQGDIKTSSFRATSI